MYIYMNANAYEVWSDGHEYFTFGNYIFSFTSVIS